MFKVAVFVAAAVLLISGDVEGGSSSSGENKAVVIRARYYGYLAQMTSSRAVDAIKEIARRSTFFDGERFSPKVQQCIDAAKKYFIEENQDYVKTLYAPIVETTVMVQNVLGGKLSKKERKNVEKQMAKINHEIEQQMEIARTMLTAHLKQDAAELKYNINECINKH